MAEADTRPRADESGSPTTDGKDAGTTSPRECHETVDPATRDEVLTEYQHRCQACGRRGPAQGGLATLHVHHIERDPDGINEHDLENLTLLCRSCHSWFHQQSTPDELPVDITEEDESVLLPQDIEILRYLADEGPARTGEISNGLTAELSVTTVRERLALLMGLDNMVDSRDQQIVDQDADTGEWGLTEQIEHSARGHIPSDPQALIQRVEDEQVRQALERGCDRETVMAVLDVSRRTTFHKEKRAMAYDFPLNAFRRGGNGGQHPAGGETSDPTGEADTSQTAAGGENQQRLDAVGEDAADSASGDVAPRGEAAQQGHADRAGAIPVDGADPELQAQLEAAITALQELTTEL
ncbi:HNH endonuclease [Halopenitus persicus]|uniref:HNH endonuclease n=1 Tax=Halopenitus persicus TaxID=1048396 RepID=A0A1H3NQ88_9EURY|nr:HNH endonuclease signature motif containing protein [Halopenitus persicus]SDY91097.1 HNH endonuclease [Halopenitus persicus]